MDDKDFSDLEKRYHAAMHAVQSGVAMMMKLGDVCEPKHLRVGIDSAHISDAAVVWLLVEKGFFTYPEFFESLVKSAEKEVKRVEEVLTQKLGCPVTLK